MTVITEKSVKDAQKLWGERIIKIGKTFMNEQNYINEAKNFIHSLYGFNEGLVLFKPTLASVEQFRDTAEKALSYFVGTAKCPTPSTI